MKTFDEILLWCRKRGFSKEYAEYYAVNPYCEAHMTCGASIPAAPPHHINSRGAHGNSDESWNLISLCRSCHRLIEQMGDKRFCEHFPAVRQKIERARAIMKGEAHAFGRPEAVQ